MAGTVARLNILLGANLAQLNRDFRGAGAIVQTAARGMMGAWTAAIGAIGAGGGIAGFAGWGVKLAAEMEQARVSFEVLADSAANGRKLLDDLWKFAAETPFEFDEVKDAGRLLLGFGVESEKIVFWLSRLGDIANATGGSLTELASIFGRNSQQGRMYTKDIKEFATRGIPILEELAKMFKVNTDEIYAMAEAGQITFADIEEALLRMTDASGRFFGLTAAQSQTAIGQWNKFVDSVKALARTMGQELLPVAVAFLSLSAGIIDSVAKWAANIGELQVKMAAAGTAFLVVVALTPVLIKAFTAITAALRGVALAQIFVQAFSGPKGWAALAAGAVAAAASYAALDYAFSSVNETMAEASAVAAQASAESEKRREAVEKERKELWELSRAAELAAQAHEKLMARGKSLESELRTPMEKYLDTLRELQELLHAAAISQETFARGATKAADELARATESQRNLNALQYRGVGAVTRYTTAGFSAEQAGKGEAAKLLEMQRLAREGDIRRERLLQEQLQFMRGQRPVNIQQAKI